MNILIFNFEYPPLGGGGGVATKQLAEEMSHRHQVTVITTGYKGLSRREVKGNVTVIRVPVIGRRSLPTASFISMISFVPMAIVYGIMTCMHNTFDVVNAQFVLPSGIPAALMSRLFSLPLVVSFIGGDLYDPTKGVSPHRHAFLRFMIRSIARQAMLRTAISEDIKTRAKELHNVRGEIVVTHLGLVPAHVSVASREDLGLPSSVALAVSIGRLIPRKSYEVLIKAVAQVPGLHLAIIGDGPLRGKVQKIIEAEQCEGRVHLLGFVDEVKKQQILRAADMYVSAAEHEGFGIVFLEAMEAGLPIVAANVGGQTDFMKDMENALLIEPHNVQVLADGIRRLVIDTQLRQTLGENNKKKVKDFYLERTAEKFEHVLTRAVELYENRD